jgi:hypothetical protein
MKLIVMQFCKSRFIWVQIILSTLDFQLLQYPLFPHNVPWIHACVDFARSIHLELLSYGSVWPQLNLTSDGNQRPYKARDTFATRAHLCMHHK